MEPLMPTIPAGQIRARVGYHVKPKVKSEIFTDPWGDQFYEGLDGAFHKKEKYDAMWKVARTAIKPPNYKINPDTTKAWLKD